MDEDAESLQSFSNDRRQSLRGSSDNGLVENGPIQAVDSMVTLQVPESGTSDADSSYGDTLTQTSITSLLSKKFKVSEITQ